MGIAEGLFIFLSSLVVVVYILAGGAVRGDLKKIIRIKDFAFASLFLALLMVRFLLISKDQWSLFDCHFWHLLGNAKLLEFLLLNRNATNYWTKIFNRWKTNTFLWELDVGKNNNNNNNNNNKRNNQSSNTTNENKIKREEKDERRQAWTDNSTSRY